MSELPGQERSPLARPRLPLFPEVGVISLVPDVWGGPWTVRHNVLTRLAKYFCCEWVNPAQGWRELWLARPGAARRPAVASVAPGLSVYTPGRLEAKFHRPAVIARAAERRRLSVALRALTRRGCRRLILYLWRPQFDFALDCVGHDLSCYHIDDEYTFSRAERPVDEREAALLKRVDRVFIHSAKLWAKKSGYNPHTHLIPTGADYRSFSTPRPEPADLRDIPHPRIGYVGYVKGQLDFPLMTELALAHPDWSFVFVGPHNANMPRYASQFEELSRRPNVYMLGGRNVEELPAYVQAMDVLTLAYRVNDYTKFICPMKLHEYLAGGRPVVGSPIPFLRPFSDVLALAGTPQEWSAALRASLDPVAVSPQRVQQRQSVARQYDWGRIVLKIAWLVCETMGSDYARRISAACGPPPRFAGRGYGEMSRSAPDSTADTGCPPRATGEEHAAAYRRTEK